MTNGFVIREGGYHATQSSHVIECIFRVFSSIGRSNRRGLEAHLASADGKNVLRVPSTDFPTIQSAVDAAQDNATIKVAQCTYNENVLIEDKSGLRLEGENAVLMGSGNLNTAGIGIKVLNSERITIRGFTVEDYELGVLLEGTEKSHVSRLEIKNNDSNTGLLRDGLALWSSSKNLITHVNSHDNGQNGITFRNGSTENKLQWNTANDNGQNAQVANSFSGNGIQLIGADHNENTIRNNETNRNGWGIQIGSGSKENEVIGNESHQNQRAGIVTLDSATDNLILRNDAEGNGVENVSPSFGFDLFDQGALDNTWKKNEGSFNH